MHFALASMGLGNPQEALKASQEAVQLYQDSGGMWRCGCCFGDVLDDDIDMSPNLMRVVRCRGFRLVMVCFFRVTYLDHYFSKKMF